MKEANNDLHIPTHYGPTLIAEAVCQFRRKEKLSNMAYKKLKSR